MQSSKTTISALLPVGVEATSAVRSPNPPTKKLPTKSAATASPLYFSPAKTLASAWNAFSEYHHFACALYLVCLTALSLNESTAEATKPFRSLSYYDPVSGLYAKGWSQDLKLVLTLSVVFILVRYTLINAILRPFAQAFSLSKSKTTRFTEQGTVLVFYTFSFVMGMLLIKDQPYLYDTDAWWKDYPVFQLTANFKLYYLGALAFWCQFLVTLHFETFRKDYLQTLSHHIITVALVSSSYHTHYTRVGHSVLVYMDSADILLCLAKCLRYFNLQTACNITFFLFTLVWIVTRHVFYYFLLHSIALRGTIFIKPELGNFEKGYYYSTTLHVAFFTLLAALQGLLIFWFAMIVKVLIKAVRGADANDDRGSDDEEEEDSEKPKKE